MRPATRADFDSEHFDFIQRTRAALCVMFPVVPVKEDGEWK